MNFQELSERYGIAKTMLYEYINAAQIEVTPNKVAHDYSDSDIKKLDAIREWVTAGNSLKNYVPPMEVQVSPVAPTNDLDELLNFSDTLIKKVRPDRISDIQAKYNFLEWAVDSGVILPTNEVKTLIGIKPNGESFIRGSYLFKRAGKVGVQNGWIVHKVI